MGEEGISGPHTPPQRPQGHREPGGSSSGSLPTGSKTEPPCTTGWMGSWGPVPQTTPSPPFSLPDTWMSLSERRWHRRGLRPLSLSTLLPVLRVAERGWPGPQWTLLSHPLEPRVRWPRGCYDLKSQPLKTPSFHFLPHLGMREPNRHPFPGSDQWGHPGHPSMNAP